MATDSITAIKDSLPPETDYLTYLTILESHLSPAILPTLNDILQDANLTQNIGWDLIQLLLPLPGAEKCLNTIARLGNPREVVLKVTEALRLLDVDEVEGEEEQITEAGADRASESQENGAPAKASEPTTVDKFCTLVSLLATLHPRIKTKYPSRFLSTSLVAVLAAYRPSNQATLAVIALLQSLSGNKRPPLPHRKSSLSSRVRLEHKPDTSAPDPEATAEDPHEGGIQKKLLQSFATHVLEVYIKANTLEWSARLQEHFEPKKVVTGKKSFGEAFKEDATLVDRDMVAGQLVAVARDLDLSECEILFDAIYTEPKALDNETEEEHPSSPEDVSLSRVGSLFLVTFFAFSSVIFDTNVTLPPMSIFPGHTTLLQQFIGTNGAPTIGTEEQSIIDSILAIGLWLENSNKFVSGPLEDEDFLQYLQYLSLLSANTPSPSLRYCAHTLLTSILHAHPVDRTRLTFILDTLENCPYETLKASAVAWLKDEIITAQERKTENVFSSTVALGTTQPYLFPDMSPLTQVGDPEAWEEVKQSFPFYMAVLNFLYFASTDAYAEIVPEGMKTVAEKIYLSPLKVVLGRLRTSLELGGELYKAMDEAEAGMALAEVQLLSERLELCVA